MYMRPQLIVTVVLLYAQVLDIDYTLFDLNSTAERPDELARPYLHHFLERCYEFYDIVIWSATSMKVCQAL